MEDTGNARDAEEDGVVLEESGIPLFVMAKRSEFPGSEPRECHVRQPDMSWLAGIPPKKAGMWGRGC